MGLWSVSAMNIDNWHEFIPSHFVLNNHHSTVIPNADLCPWYLGLTENSLVMFLVLGPTEKALHHQE